MLTVVSGFWLVTNKYTNRNKYTDWFKNTLRINMPYIFFGNKEIIDIVKEIRHDLPTHYIEIDITEFEVYKYKDYIVTDPVHVPSVELSLIWLNKVFLIQKATQINPFNTELFAWIDAGICIYRNHHPPLRPFDFDKIAKLPRNKFIFCSTEYNCFIPDLVMDNNIYHYLSGNFIIDINMINIFCLIYSEFLEKNVPKKMLCYSSEQVIFTHMYKSFGDNMFHKYGDGYGSIINNLYTKKDGDSLIKTDWFKEQLIYHH